MKRILILMSTYNGSKYLSEQLNSIIQQIGVNPFIIVRDDCSTDNTLDILNGYRQKYPTIFVDIIKGENVGFARSFSLLVNKAISVVNDNLQCFDYFAFADQDDVWQKDKLSTAVCKLSHLDSNKPNLYFSNAQLVDEKLLPIKMFWNKNDVIITKERALVQNYALGCTMVFNREMLNYYSLFDNHNIVLHDFLVYQIATILGEVTYDDTSHILYRQHGSNQIGKPDFIKRYIHRFKFKGNMKKHVLELNTINFLNTYKSYLSVNDIYMMSKVAFYRYSIWNKLLLLFNTSIKYNKIEYTFFYKIKILLNGL